MFWRFMQLKNIRGTNVFSITFQGANHFVCVSRHFLDYFSRCESLRLCIETTSRLPFVVRIILFVYRDGFSITFCGPNHFVCVSRHLLDYFSSCGSLRLCIEMASQLLFKVRIILFVYETSSRLLFEVRITTFAYRDDFSFTFRGANHYVCVSRRLLDYFSRCGSFRLRIETASRLLFKVRIILFAYRDGISTVGANIRRKRIP